MRARLLAASVVLAIGLLGFSLSAQQPSRNDTIFDAIRRNDLAALTTAVRERGVDVTTPSGLTPLVLAAAFGTPEAVNTLLEAGADVNEPATGGITPLHVAWRDPVIARALVEKGAAVATKTQQQSTPLLVAASANGTADVVALLLAHGADVNAADSRGVTPLIAAASAGNHAVAMLLLGRGAAPDAYASAIGQKNVTPLMGAAMNGDMALARVLLRSKPDVNRLAPDNDGTVRNGKVALGNFTALHLAAASRNPEMVKLLIDAGASIEAPDVRGFTPLVWAVSSDRANPAVVRTLVRAGADPLVSSTNRDTPADWARRYNDRATLAALKLTPAHAAVRTAAASAAAVDARAAAERALPLLRSAAARVMTDGGCVACHAQPLTVMATALAASRGWGTGTDNDALNQVRQAVNSGVSGFLHGRETGGQPDSHEFNLLAMSVANVAPTPATDAFAYYLAAKQRDAGNWHALTGRAPMQDGDITRTALGIRALTVYGTPARRAEVSGRVERAARWLSMQQASSTEERVMQLLGLVWAQADTRKITVLQRQLVNLQRADGGWAQAAGLASDAYATGEVLYTLSQLQGAPASSSVRRAVEYLLRSQADDGSWHVTSRALKIQPYFESGFPYGHDQWISHAGSAWAVVGLAASAGPAGSPASTVARRP